MGIGDTHAQKADLKALSTCRSRLSMKDLMQVACPFRLFSMDVSTSETCVMRSEAAQIRLAALQFGES